MSITHLILLLQIRVPRNTYSMVSRLTLSSVSRFARSNWSWYLSIRRALSQSCTVDTADRSVGVGLSSG